MNPYAKGTLGNRSRTGMPRPLGSGRPKMLGKHLTSLCIRVDVEELRQWWALAHARGCSMGALVREAMADMMEEETHETEQ